MIENFGTPVLERWGCGYEDLLGDKSDLVMLSLSGYGRDGPRANYLAYGVTVASYLGLATAWGYAHGTLTDYVAGATGALATVAALEQTRRDGHLRTSTSPRSTPCRRCWRSSMRRHSTRGLRPRPGVESIAGIMAVQRVSQQGI